MITLNTLIQHLLSLQAEGYGELPVIYSSDDEGNNRHTVIYEPSPFIVEDINQYYLESAIEYDNEDLPIDFIPNCIIIN